MRRNQGRYRRIIIRLDEAEETLIKDAAKADFLRPSTWARPVLLRAALERLRERDRDDPERRTARAVAEGGPRRKRKS